MPMELQPLFRWKMQRAREGRMYAGLARFAAANRPYIDQVLDEVRRRGPVTGGEFAPEGPRRSGWWEWSDGKRALEWLFWAGFITTKTRRGFERVYDLTERAIPPRSWRCRPPARPTRSASWCAAPPRRWASPPSPTSPTISASTTRPTPSCAPANWSRKACWRR